jgi:hypothetical protein
VRRKHSSLVLSTVVQYSNRCDLEGQKVLYITFQDMKHSAVTFEKNERDHDFLPRRLLTYPKRHIYIQATKHAFMHNLKLEQALASADI